MNKTTTANIGGFVFHMDIEAYDKLQNYLIAISRYFDKSDGKDEIMSDIETRIAELFKERMKNDAQVIAIADVNEVIKIMGEPEQYADPDAESDTEDKYRSQYYRTSARRDNNQRRLFRDPDNRVLGGVCTGMGYYFGVNPVWIRLFFLLAFFGLGTGVLLYIILWVLIPEAKTTAEKLEMRGEPINIDNIGKTIDEEFGKVKDKFNEFASNAGSRGASNKVGNTLERFFQFVGDIFKHLVEVGGKVAIVIISVLSKIFGIVFLLIGAILLILLIASFFNSASILSITSEGFHYYSIHQLFSYISTNPMHWTLLWIAGVLFIGIPVLALLYGGIRLLFPFPVNVKRRGLGISLFILWLIGVVITIVLIFQIGMEFKNEARVTEEAETNAYNGNVLYIDINQSMFADILDETFDKKYSFRFRSESGEVQMLKFDNLLFQPEGDHHFVGIPKLHIRRGFGNKPQVKYKKYAVGITQRQAESRARAINYHFVQNDSLLVFDPVFKIDDEMLFRAQTLKIELLLPENTIIDLSNSSDRLVSIGDLSSNWIKTYHRNWNWKMGGYKWIMKNDGLVCLNCDNIPPPPIDTTQQEKVNNIELY